MTDTATVTEAAAPGESGPRYAQIQKTLENRVIDGTYAVGTLIPTEIALVEEFNASRTTIREALRYLRERGYVERRQGVGTRVISNTSRSAFSQSFSSLEELFQVAAETFFVILEVKDVELSGEIADQVGGNAGEIWKLVNGVRWSEPGGKPLAYVQCYVPKRFESIIPEFHDAKGPFFAVLERRSGWAIEEVVQEIRAVPMPSDMERHLGLRSGAWALQLLRRYVSEHGVLISSYNWHPADQMAYIMRIQRDHERGD